MLEYQGNLLEDKKVLIVDDNQLNRMVFKKIFKKCFNTDVLLANNGKECVDMFGNQNDIGFILMDLMMPVLDGVSATQEIRKQSKDVVIVACSGKNSQTEVDKCLAAGANDYLPKPLDPVKLNTILEGIFTKN